MRYTATDRGYLDIRMAGSDDPYGALEAFLDGKGEKPLLHGEMTIVVERLCDLTAFRTKWILLPEEYELEAEEGNAYLNIDFLRIGDDCE